MIKMGWNIKTQHGEDLIKTAPIQPDQFTGTLFIIEKPGHAVQKTAAKQRLMIERNHMSPIGLSLMHN